MGTKNCVSYENDERTRENVNEYGKKLTEIEYEKKTKLEF